MLDVYTRECVALAAALTFRAADVARVVLPRVELLGGSAGDLARLRERIAQGWLIIWAYQDPLARILRLAASTMETDVAQALERLLEAGTVPTAEQVRAGVSPERPEVPALAVGAVDLTEYDGLLAQYAEMGA